MSADDPTPDDLARRQRDLERAERESLADARTDADADRHRRRADKARYLREKLVEQEKSERDADRDAD